MSRPGINVIGHVRANLGVGVVTRQVIDLLEKLGHPVAAFDVDGGRRPDALEQRHEPLIHPRADTLPHRINLFVLGLGAVDWTLRMCPESFFTGDHVNAIVCFWELPVMPAARLAQLDGFDVVIAASDFMRHVFEQSLTRATVIGATLPIAIPDASPFDRARMGIPPSATVLVFSFDPASDPERKNPHGAVSAFRQGVGADTNAWLVLRINNATKSDGTPHAVVDELRRATLNHPRIVLLTESLTYSEVLGLYRACNVYVSLHRAEGLGLAMAEAMTLGMAVIATGWSGNMTFMRQTNAYLVKHHMVTARGTLPAYREGGLVGEAKWAEPDTAHAAALMAYATNHRNEVEALGRAAAASMAAFNETAWRGRFIDELVVFAERETALAGYGYRRTTAFVGRPLLQAPREPAIRQLREATATFGQRVVRKLAKVLRRQGHRVQRGVEPPVR